MADAEDLAPIPTEQFVEPDEPDAEECDEDCEFDAGDDDDDAEFNAVPSEVSDAFYAVQSEAEFGQAAPGAGAKKKQSEVLDEASIKPELDRLTQEAVEMLNMPPSAARRLMRYYEWNSDRLGRYFEDPDKVLQAIGIQSIGDKGYEKVANDNKERTCPLCLEPYSSPEEGNFWALLPCHHAVCGDCWTGLVTDSVKRNGRESAALKCPVVEKLRGQLQMTACKTEVDEEIFLKFLPEDLKARYLQFRLRFFLETHPQYRCCANRGCSRVLKRLDRTLRDVECECGAGLCFACNQEAHSPATCDQWKRWLDRADGDSASMQWIANATKPCPECHTATEKNEGCMHMTCRLCEAKGKPKDWCWICGGVWDFQGRHGSNWYDPPCKKDTDVEKKQKQAAAASNSLYKYTHAYDQYMEHKKTGDLQAAKDVTRARDFTQKLLEREVRADHIPDAAKAIAEARKYLQYMYVYSYYLPEGKVDFFDWKVKEVEAAVAHLSNVLEDLYRWEPSIQRPQPPHSRDAVIKAVDALRKRVADLRDGVEEDARA
eukprot:TRINITY_DN6502_c0_g1_i1.p1 TRINITY_DN6502_c0_g1~~TRINITY_DN6502_c0_g1_i1.p1  ORF type:complete len:555 (+),score=120.96 TRINITY_DN6502_c0_g1_i1:36-1667(+)